MKALLLLLIVFMFSDGVAQQTPSEIELIVKVLDRSNNRAVEGAKVSVKLLEGTTDDQGHAPLYLPKRLLNSSIAIRVEHEEYEIEPKYDYNLTAESLHNYVEIKLVKLNNNYIYIDGEVRDEQNEPLKDVKVNFRNKDVRLDTITDDFGFFVFKIPKGVFERNGESYSISFGHDSFKAHRENKDLSFGGKIERLEINLQQKAGLVPLKGSNEQNIPKKPANIKSSSYEPPSLMIGGQIYNIFNISKSEQYKVKIPTGYSLFLLWHPNDYLQSRLGVGASYLFNNKITIANSYKTLVDDLARVAYNEYKINILKVFARFYAFRTNKNKQIVNPFIGASMFYLRQIPKDKFQQTLPNESENFVLKYNNLNNYVNHEVFLGLHFRISNSLHTELEGSYSVYNLKSNSYTFNVFGNADKKTTNAEFPNINLKASILYTIF